MITNVESALSKACELMGGTNHRFYRSSGFMKGNEGGAHEWIFEFSQHPDNLDHFIDAFDKHLKTINSDYEAKRYNNMTLKRPIVHIAKENLFYHWLEAKGKLGGQNKSTKVKQ